MTHDEIINDGQPVSFSILVVDDDVSLRTFLTKALLRHGYNVDDVENGKEAIEAFDSKDKKDVYDLVITDIVMPHMNGTELASYLKLHYPKTKVMFMTGFSAMALNDKGCDKGIKAVSKPFHLGDIVQKVQNLLSQ